MTKEQLDSAKREKAIDLNNSKPLFFWWMSENPEVKRAVDIIFQEFTDGREKTIRKPDKYKRHFFIFMADPFRIYQMSPETWISYSRRRGDYKAKSRYTFMGYKISITVSDFLTEAGYPPKTNKSNIQKNLLNQGASIQQLNLPLMH